MYAPDTLCAKAWLRLARLKGLPLSRKRALVEAVESVDVLFETSVSELLQITDGDQKTVHALTRSFDDDVLQADQKWLEIDHHYLITLHDERYPELLKQLDDAPLALYLAGDPDTLRYPQIAVVGSRNPTPVGRETAFNFAKQLATAGFAITSGFALGVDGAAHKGALAAGGKTIAVTANGLNRVYPKTHRDLAIEIFNTGAVISEFPIDTEPRREYFPQRNRIICGMASGTLVVEAATRSGSLITARLAGDQGREVFAIPGSIHSPTSKGCHQLIKQGAKLVDCVDDIYAELRWLLPSSESVMIDATEDAELNETSSGSPQETAAKLPATDIERLLGQIDYAETPLDMLIERTQLTADQVSSMLLELELDGKIKSAPGGCYIRVT